MESNKKELINIATGDPEIVKEVIKTVNKVYKTAFEYEDSEERDGVEFALVERGNSTVDEIFLLGFYYGAKVKELRSKKEIDW